MVEQQSDSSLSANFVVRLELYSEVLSKFALNLFKLAAGRLDEGSTAAYWRKDVSSTQFYSLRAEQTYGIWKRQKSQRHLGTRNAQICIYIWALFGRRSGGHKFTQAQLDYCCRPYGFIEEQIRPRYFDYRAVTWIPIRFFSILPRLTRCCIS